MRSWVGVWLCLGTAASTCPATVMGQEERSVLEAIYREAETATREAADKMFSQTIDAFERHQKRKLRDDEIRLARGITFRTQYQRVIDPMPCWETALDEGKGKSSLEVSQKATSCAAERQRKAEELFRFVWDYNSVPELERRSILCEAKSRLLHFEIRYPPYSFMTEDIGDTPPKALDVRVFLECIKAGL